MSGQGLLRVQMAVGHQVLPQLGEYEGVMGEGEGWGCVLDLL